MELPTAEPGAPGAPGPQRVVDANALARQQRRLHAAPEPPWLHREVARRLAERLPIVKLQPQVVIDWGARLGAGAGVLRRQYPKAQLLAVEPEVSAASGVASAPAATSAQVGAGAAPWWSPRRWSRADPPAHTAASLPPGAGQLLWSNMGLHFAPDPQAELKRWHRAIAVDGFLMFSTLGPGSLLGLSKLYAQAGRPPPMAPFVDMHDLGDMLVEAGFADPVMDQESLTLTWPDARALLAELRSLGGNTHPGRAAGLRTPRWRQRLEGEIERQLAGPQGRCALVFEIVYGHAFRPMPRARLKAQTSVPFEDLRTMARRNRR
jgi:malonyl-CoA O-methyltransferase